MGYPKLLLFFLILTGCQSSYKTDDFETERTLIAQELAATSDKLQNQLNDFSRFFLHQDAQIKLPNRDSLALDEEVMNRHVFIDWSGPVPSLLQDLCKLTGYHYQVIGPQPPLPAIVTLAHQRIKILDVIRDVALQIHQKADLVVFPDEKLIELRYR